MGPTELPSQLLKKTQKDTSLWMSNHQGYKVIKKKKTPNGGWWMSRGRPGGPGVGGHGGFCGGFDSSTGVQGWGCRACRGQAKDSTKLDHLVKDMKIKSLKEIYLFFLPIRLSEIIDFWDHWLFPGASLKSKVLKIMPRQSRPVLASGPGSRHFVITGDYKRHVNLGVKCVRR